MGKLPLKSFECLETGLQMSAVLCIDLGWYFNSKYLQSAQDCDASEQKER